MKRSLAEVIRKGIQDETERQFDIEALAASLDRKMAKALPFLRRPLGSLQLPPMALAALDQVSSAEPSSIKLPIDGRGEVEIVDDHGRLVVFAYPLQAGPGDVEVEVVLQLSGDQAREIKVVIPAGKSSGAARLEAGSYAALRSELEEIKVVRWGTGEEGDAHDTPA